MISLKNTLLESTQKTSNILISVDIQPEYTDHISFSLPKFFDFLMQSDYDIIHWLYNGHETLGMITENNLKGWVGEQIDYNEDVINTIKFYDKGYAFFRYCLDSSIDEDKIVDLVRMMYKSNVHDSRDLDKEFWKKFIRNHGHEDIRELLEFAGDCINIPDLMQYLNKSINQQCDIVGGGISECLKEVEIAMSAIGKKYTVLNSWTY